MAIIKCAECGHDVSEFAVSCPNCGCPVEKSIEKVDTPQEKSATSDSEVLELSIEHKKHKKAIILAVVFVVLLSAIIVYLTCGTYLLAKVAYNNSNYEKVVSLLVAQKPSEKTDNLLYISLAQMAYKDAEYASAIDYLSKVENGEALPIYIDAFEKLQQEIFEETKIKTSYAIEESDGKFLSNVINEYDGVYFEELAAFAYYELLQKCTDYNYDAFLCIDEAVKLIQDDNVCEQLKELADNDLLRMKSFLNASWEWRLDEDNNNDFTRVVLHMDSDGNNVGILKVIGSYLESYHYCVNDVYWKDFVFNDGSNPDDDSDYTCYNMTRYTDGSINGQIAVAYVDYDNNLLKLRVSYANNPDRIWTRVR